MEPPVQYRQGDVLLVRVAKPFDLATMRKLERGSRGIVLAEGEATGHAHVIADEGAVMFRAPNGQELLEIEAPVRVIHEEHATVDLEPGVYRVVRQREYDPETDRVLRVKD